MKPQSAKAKGRRFQQTIRDLLLEAAAAWLSEDDIRSTSMGASGEDLLLSPLARSIYPISPEMKNVERLNIWQALAQAEGHESEGMLPCTPVVFFTRNHADNFACLPAEELVRLYTRVYEMEKLLSLDEAEELGI